PPRDSVDRPGRRRDYGHVERSSSQTHRPERPERHRPVEPHQLQGVPARAVMEPTPLYDFFRRGEAARDVRMLAAQGGLAPRASEQLNILVLLLEDPDPEVRQT